MKIEFGKCKRCNLDKPIINKKYYLCDICNKKRLGTFKDLSSTKTLKSSLSSLKSKKTTKSNKIKHISKKESQNKQNLKNVYEKIDSEREHKCEGCGQRFFLSHSHLITQRNKKYQCDPENIVYHCMERQTPDKFGNKGCHSRWESGQWDQIETLQNAQLHLEYIKERDKTLYNKILNSKNEY